MSNSERRPDGDGVSPAIRFSPGDIAKALSSVDSRVRQPTSEQDLIIAAPLEPAVVIAGAGSGKTETMSARVLYLVANALVEPGEILGLTFTRKAAGELGLRIRSRLRQLRTTGLLPANISIDTPVMTYHSYAGRLLAEHAIRYGIDASSEPIGDAAIWQMAADLVSNWPDENFSSESALNTVIADVIGLSSLMLEHQCSSNQVIKESTKVLERIDQMSMPSNEVVRKVQKVLNQRISILPMVEEFIARRRRDGLLTFDDQMSLAADISMGFPDVVETERSRFRVVLLDEYQDTSQTQVRMLSTLFGDGHPVMAVGDPCQAIYTWRGASAGTIGAFAANFPKGEQQRGPSQFSLSTTFRNDEVILELANQVSAEIREEGAVKVQPLGARDDAGPGELASGIFETMGAEANAIAEHFSGLWFNPMRMSLRENQRTSFAVLVRKRSQIPEIEIALRGVNIPVEVVGVGGLIHVAEVADVITLLHVITDPDAGAALMRHLTGPRLFLGAADIAALGRFSRSRAEASNRSSKGLIAKIAAGNPLREEADDQFLGSLIDSLDEIEQADSSHFSPAGFTRLTHFAADLRRLRSRAGGPMTDLISQVEEYLSLDVEVMLRDGFQNGRRHLDRFMDEAAKFSHSGGTTREFLAWLGVASSEEGGLKSGAPEVRRDVVQILTVHSAKGAEWDVVAIPGLAVGTFPGVSRGGKENWLTNEKHIPFALRGDAAELPTFSLEHCTSNTELKKVFEQFSHDCDALKNTEEIRLGYVAVTRARTHLLCTTSRWRDGSNPVAPSLLYEDVARTAALHGGKILSDAPVPAVGEKNPLLESPLTGSWPRDPLGIHRESFEAAISLVRSTPVHSLEDDVDQNAQSWIRDARTLINEGKQARETVEVFLPPRLAVSTLVALKDNVHELALSIRRPMPRKQDEYSRRGTAFHLWVEKYFGQGVLFDEEDLDPVDQLESDQSLEGLKKSWLASQWGARQPFAVEVPFETVLAGTLVRGRIDAIYKNDENFEVIDWKTGSKPLGESAAVQLAVYRLAWAKLKGIDLAQVSAAFHYIPTGVTDRRADLMDEAALIAIIDNQPLQSIVSGR
jgi:DNA helicase-2/ATP-dependent DNA helicase PcrA